MSIQTLLRNVKCVRTNADMWKGFVGVDLLRRNLKIKKSETTLEIILVIVITVSA